VQQIRAGFFQERPIRIESAQGWDHPGQVLSIEDLDGARITLGT
jgi:hypothetical protein